MPTLKYSPTCSILHESENEVAQSCLTLCDPMDSSLHQAPPSMEFSRQEVLEWVAIKLYWEINSTRADPFSVLVTAVSSEFGSVHWGISR